MSPTSFDTPNSDITRCLSLRRSDPRKGAKERRVEVSSTMISLDPVAERARDSERTRCFDIGARFLEHKCYLLTCYCFVNGLLSDALDILVDGC